MICVVLYSREETVDFNKVVTYMITLEIWGK